MSFEVILNYIISSVTSLGIKLIEAAVILFIGMKLIKWVKKFLRTSHRLDRIDNSIRSFLVSFCGIALYVLLVITLAMVVGIPVTSFITVLASCGVAIGLALQGSLSNFAGGVMILLFKPFCVGDFIEASGESGTVEEISVVYTVLKTGDNKKVTIPNGSLTNSIIKNYSAEKTRRVDMVFTAGYGCDIDKVKSVIEGVIAAEPLALSDPAPLVRLSNHGDSALEYNVRVWSENADYWTVYYNITEGVKKAFDENGIDIPYPQMDVHMDK